MTKTITSQDGQRRVTFRMAKRSLPNRRFDMVETAQLKKLVDGKWIIVASTMSAEAGHKFLEA